jgi:Tol biopolymer transport system component
VILAMNADGSGVTPLTGGNMYGDTQPSWSPDSKRIAFASGFCYDTCRTDIVIMNADGSGAHFLTSGGEHPTWSPQGQKIAFATPPSDWDPTVVVQIIVRRADGSDEAFAGFLTPYFTTLVAGSHPAWRR